MRVQCGVEGVERTAALRACRALLTEGATAPRVASCRGRPGGRGGRGRGEGWRGAGMMRKRRAVMGRGVMW